MPFNPKLVHRDGEAPPVEADWPDDLALLAGQLEADAARLAASYPADGPAPMSAARRAPVVAWTRRLGVLAAAVVVGGCAQFWRPLHRPPASGYSPAPPIAAPAPPQAAVPIAAPTVTPGVFQALTGPEQEALLDLMETQRLEQASLAI
jgi:hypothetical protein